MDSSGAIAAGVWETLIRDDSNGFYIYKCPFQSRQKSCIQPYTYQKYHTNVLEGCLIREPAGSPERVDSIKMTPTVYIVSALSETEI